MAVTSYELFGRKRTLGQLTADLYGCRPHSSMMYVDIIGIEGARCLAFSDASSIFLDLIFFHRCILIAMINVSFLTYIFTRSNPI